ncbi:alpha-L-fucosidase [Asticcacaulis machinosus]|uniref:alpha-L-fucosidase n=1 Tax=Asticcacaulis machinosus TaxID=2984211 RepID=A0ABT5HH63_9CAUL|nr:alpha-L-fucosidase [Asticcacaulis machinosus]MDC7675590.1 alpha-L-fucosidase [Asticcacaulis machinosus]
MKTLPLMLTACWFAMSAIPAQGQAPTPPRKVLKQPAKPIPDGPVQPNWSSLKAYYQVPEWFKDAKFGLFIHWGVYSVPAAQSEWYPRHMYRTAGVIKLHETRFGAQDKFGYKDFIPQFKAERFDPDLWADLFVASGARYVIPVAEHHDGFAMYDSKLTKWDAKDMGPKRDLLGDLMVSVRKRGLKFGVSNHRIEHWGFMYPTEGLKTDLFDPKYADFYGPPQPQKTGMPSGMGEIIDNAEAPQSEAFQEEWLLRTQEQIDKFQPDLLWFDNGINPRSLDPVKLRLAAYYYNSAETWGRPVTLTTKKDAYLEGTVKDYERQWQAPFSLQTAPYQVDDALGDKWGYVEGMGHLSAQAVLYRLIENVSRGGNLLLNISPKADGTIPDDQAAVLRDVGGWLKVNGEAIYGTRTWKQDNDSIVRYTRKGDTLYAILLAWPEDTLNLMALPQNIGRAKQVTLIGSDQPVKFTQNDAGMNVTLPGSRTGRHAYVLKIEGMKLSDPAAH